MYILSKKKLLFLYLCLASLLIPQENQTKEVEFLRIEKGALQTAIYTMSSKNLEIKLKIIGVIHVGEVAYYKNIYKITKELDYVYYEGIQMENSWLSSPKAFFLQTSVNSSKKDIQNISTFQNEFARYFDLVEQTEYLKPRANWINADVKFSDFLHILKNLEINLEQLSQNLALNTKVWLEQDNAPEDTVTIQDPREVVVQKYKRKMARYLIRSAKELCYDENMKLPREAIIIARNKVALTYLDEKLKSQVPLEIGLLYGAAHIPHFVEVMQNHYNFTIEQIEWLDAWRLDIN